VTLVCVGCGYWVHWSKEWIRQRHGALVSGKVSPSMKHMLTTLTKGPAVAPAGLWLFGEHGIYGLIVYRDSGESIDDIQRLFPEAHVIQRPSNSGSDSLRHVWWTEDSGPVPTGW
jgi:hypothetical protein